MDDRDTETEIDVTGLDTTGEKSLKMVEDDEEEEEEEEEADVTLTLADASTAEKMEKEAEKDMTMTTMETTTTKSTTTQPPSTADMAALVAKDMEAIESDCSLDGSNWRWREIEERRKRRLGVEKEGGGGAADGNAAAAAATTVAEAPTALPGLPLENIKDAAAAPATAEVAPSLADDAAAEPASGTAHTGVVPSSVMAPIGAMSSSTTPSKHDSGAASAAENDAQGTETVGFFFYASSRGQFILI